MLYTALASRASVAGMASSTIALGGFTVDNRDSLEWFFSRCMLFAQYAVEQNVDLPAAPFFMFLQYSFHGTSAAPIRLKAHIEKIHIQPEIFRDGFRGQPRP